MIEVMNIKREYIVDVVFSRGREDFAIKRLAK